MKYANFYDVGEVKKLSRKQEVPCNQCFFTTQRRNIHIAVEKFEGGSILMLFIIMI